jgi:membrane associated rhomboid family serine protease
MNLFLASLQVLAIAIVGAVVGFGTGKLYFKYLSPEARAERAKNRGATD